MKKTATELFDQMMAFANYAFNKSHACAYAVVAYQTAYLKCYYPVEFMTALLNSFIASKQKLGEYIQTIKNGGYQDIAAGRQPVGHALHHGKWLHSFWTVGYFVCRRSGGRGYYAARDGVSGFYRFCGKKYGRAQ